MSVARPTVRAVAALRRLQRVLLLPARVGRDQCVDLARLDEVAKYLFLSGPRPWLPRPRQLEPVAQALADRAEEVGRSGVERVG